MKSSAGNFYLTERANESASLTCVRRVANLLGTTPARKFVKETSFVFPMETRFGYYVRGTIVMKYRRNVRRRRNFLRGGEERNKRWRRVGDGDGMGGGGDGGGGVSTYVGRVENVNRIIFLRQTFFTEFTGQMPTRCWTFRTEEVAGITAKTENRRRARC